MFSFEWFMLLPATKTTPSLVIVTRVHHDCYIHILCACACERAYARGHVCVNAIFIKLFLYFDNCSININLYRKKCIVHTDVLYMSNIQICMKHIFNIFTWLNLPQGNNDVNSRALCCSHITFHFLVHTQKTYFPNTHMAATTVVAAVNYAHLKHVGCWWVLYAQSHH